MVCWGVADIHPPDRHLKKETHLTSFDLDRGRLGDTQEWRRMSLEDGGMSPKNGGELHSIM